MKQKKILIADDDLGLLSALTIRLEATGYEVIATQDSYQALQSAIENRPDLLLLDINMPAGDGFTVHDRLQNVPDLAPTPVIYITGDTSGQTTFNAHVHGAIAVFHKPFELDNLLTVIEKVLELSAAKQAVKTKEV